MGPLILAALEKLAGFLSSLASFLHDRQQQNAGAAIAQNGELKTIATERDKADAITHEVSAMPASAVDDGLREFTRD